MFVLIALGVVDLTGLAIVALGLLATIVATLAAVAAVLRPRAALWLGAAAVLLSTASAATGVTQALLLQREADRRVAAVYLADQPVVKERILRTDYHQARAFCRAAASCSWLAFVVGTASLLAAVVRLARAGSDEGHRSTAWLLAAGAISTLGLLAVGFAFLRWHEPLPGRDLEPDDPAWRVAESVDDVMRPGSPRFEQGCRGLGMLFWRGPGRPAWGAMRVPDFLAAAGRCFDSERAEAMTATTSVVVALHRVPPVDPSVPVTVPQSATELDHRYRSLQRLVESPLLLDPRRKQRLEDDLAALLGAWPTPPAAPFHDRRPPKVSAGTAVVTGELPRDLIERFLQTQLGSVADCYMFRALEERLSGEVKLRFTIGSSGHVGDPEDAGSTFPDSDMVRCVVGSVYSLRFPPPVRGKVTVTVPFQITPPKRR